LRLLIVLFLLSGFPLTDTCPYDGETAYFTTIRFMDDGTWCNYRHPH